MALARKIARAKWEARAGLGEGEVPADALYDVKTTGNDLSVWRTAATDEGLRDVALAFAAAADSVGKIELVWFDEAAIEQAGLLMANTAGDTPVADLQGTHSDIQRLDAARLVGVAGIISSALATSQHKVFTVGAVRQLVIDAVLAGRVLEAQLSEKLQQELGPRIALARQQQQQQQQQQ